MNRWKWTALSAFALLILTNILWLFIWVYSAIDAGVTYTYQQESLDRKTQAVDLLGGLIVKGSREYSKKDMLYMLRQAHKDAFIVDEGNTIHIDGVQFIFENGKLSKIKG